MAAAGKIGFLNRVMGVGEDGRWLPALSTHDAFVRDNVLVAAEALHLRLIKLVNGMDGFSYDIAITPGGRLLARGLCEEAAAAVDSGATVTRILGQPPWGTVASKLRPGGPGVSLSGSWARNNAAEILRGVATGNLVAEGGMVRRLPERLEAREPENRVGRRAGRTNLWSRGR